LMDVISGAMGAFLIIMIILARYYVFDPEVTQNVDELKLRLDAAVEGLNKIRGGTEEIFDETIKSRSGASTRGLEGGNALDQIEALSRGIRQDVDRVNNQLGEVQSQLNQVEEELQEKSAQLTRAEERIKVLERRNAFVVQALYTCEDDVDLFIESNREYAGNDDPPPPFDPRVERGQGFTGDNSLVYSGGPAAEIQMVGEAISDTKYKIFVNLGYPPAANANCAVRVNALGDGDFWERAGSTTLTAQNPFDFMGVVSVDKDQKISFAAPTDAERKAELAIVRQRLANTPAPNTEDKK
ncbi:MAG: hypothetical protein R3C60_11750, partial [Parvularculaceae bacterium]